MFVLNFLGRFQENSLLENVNLCVQCSFRKHNELLQVLAQIVPMISSIRLIKIDSPDPEIDLFKMVYDNNDTIHGYSHESQLLLKEMMAKTQFVIISWFILLFIFFMLFF
jgi:uncharacterized protein (UPF0254 family)